MTVPDTYPLSLNALTAGCNQKTARDPILAATEAEVLSAVDELKRLALVVEVSGSRVTRYEHNVRRVLEVPTQSVALLATLVLRGPQTAAELRANTERLHRFADVSAVEGFLDELAARPAERGGPLVVKLPRAPGAREARWAQLLMGPVDAAWLSVPASADGGAPVAGPDSVQAGEIAALRAHQGRLQAEVDLLRRQLAQLAADLGAELKDG
ncbi:MAG: YceH family protein [Ideonella sp.]|nr:YceH family protein [Ideonella sp.]